MKKIIEFLNAIHLMPEALQILLFNTTRILVVKKGDILLRHGEVCDKLYFIEKGMLCCYGQDEVDNKSYCEWFMLEGDVATSVESFSRQTPAAETITALEDGICWYITKK